MGSLLPAVSMSNLYPVRHDENTGRIVDELLSPERDGWKAILRRPITADERALLSQRAAAIGPHLTPADKRQIVQAVSEMLAGFRSSARTEEIDGMATVAQFVSVLRDLPLWAIQRACGRFARGEVTPSEVGSDRIERAFAPTTAQLRMVAAKIAEPALTEAHRLTMVLNGVTRSEDISDAERKRVAGLVTELAEKLKSDLEMERAKRRGSVDAFGSFDLAKANRIARADYDRLGMVPVEGPEGMLVSIPLLLTLGHEIMEMPDGEVALVKKQKPDDEL